MIPNGYDVNPNQKKNKHKIIVMIETSSYEIPSKTIVISYYQIISHKKAWFIPIKKTTKSNGYPQKKNRLIPIKTRKIRLIPI
jgi:hypothetical protein